VLVDATAVTSGRLATSRPVVAADGDEPVLTRLVLLLQDLGSEGEIAVRVEQVAWVVIVMRLVAQIDLAQPGIDTTDRRPDQRPAQPSACCGPRGIALTLAGDIERPGPRDQAAPQARSVSCSATAYSTGDGTPARCAASW
jgi:hypothetical protein